MGPTGRTASVSQDVSNPMARGVTFDQLREGLRHPGARPRRGGVDLLLLETVFDTLNAKAALFGLEEIYFKSAGRRVPVIVLRHHRGPQRAHPLGADGPKAFWISVSAHTAARGWHELRSRRAADMRPFHRRTRAAWLPSPSFCYPNAGLPNAFGGGFLKTLRAHGRRRWANSRAAAGSTLPAAAAALRPRTSAPSAKPFAAVAPRVPPPPSTFSAAISGFDAGDSPRPPTSSTIGERTNAGSRNLPNSSARATTKKAWPSRANKSKAARRWWTSTWTGFALTTPEKAYTDHASSTPLGSGRHRARPHHGGQLALGDPGSRPEICCRARASSIPSA